MDMHDGTGEARTDQTATRRPVAAGIEPLIEQRVNVLDHGFIRVIDYMGDDAAVVQAARVSYGRGTRKVSEDEGLIRYLMRHRHSTPFEMCEIKLHVKLPIFVARQWIRHRTANVNEYSARYSVMDREFYIPAPEHLAAQSATNRQGRGDVLEGDEAAEVLALLRDDANRNYAHYELMLNETGADPARKGLARELARMNLTLNAYTQWYWKTDLHNLFHFLSLRSDPHAQYEIRAYAEAMLDITRAWVPASCRAFEEYRMNARTLSASMVKAVRDMMAGKSLPADTPGLSGRERAELMEILDIG